MFVKCVCVCLICLIVKAHVACLCVYGLYKFKSICMYSPCIAYRKGTILANSFQFYLYMDQAIDKENM